MRRYTKGFLAKEAEGNKSTPPNFETFETIYDLIIMKVDQDKCLLSTNAHIYKKNFGLTRLKELVLSEPDRRLLEEWKRRENYDHDGDFHRYHLQPLSVSPETTPSSPVPIPPGLFKGEYNELGSECTELVHLSYQEDAGGVTFTGRKITGDIHVPAEKISFEGSLNDCLMMTLDEQVRADESNFMSEFRIYRTSEQGSMKDGGAQVGSKCEAEQANCPLTNLTFRVECEAQDTF